VSLCLCGELLDVPLFRQLGPRSSKIISRNVNRSSDWFVKRSSGWKNLWGHSMNHKNLAVLCLLMFGSLLFGLQGCDITYTVVNQAPDPYANAHSIQRRAQFQIDRVNTAWQANQLNADMAAVLKDNDFRIYWLAKQEVDANNPPQDINANQTYNLQMMLADNDNNINDAIARHDQWAQAFQGGWDAGYNAPSQPLNQCYLTYQLQRQETQVNNAVAAGQLTPNQAQDIRGRIQVVLNVQMNYYRQNGRLTLTDDQSQELRRMTDDNERYLAFRTRRPDDQWNGDRYEKWGQRNQEPQNNTPPAWRQNPPAAAPQVQAKNNTAPSTAPAEKAGPVRDSGTSPAPSTGAAVRPQVQTQVNGSVQMAQLPAAAQPTVSAPAPAVKTTVSKGAKPAPAAKPQIQYLAAAPIQNRLKKQTQTFNGIRQSGKLKPPQTNLYQQKTIKVNQALSSYMKQNHQKGLTQAQFDQLNKQLDDLDNTMAGFQKKK